jgi:hypothetical protein
MRRVAAAACVVVLGCVPGANPAQPADPGSAAPSVGPDVAAPAEPSGAAAEPGASGPAAEPAVPAGAGSGWRATVSQSVSVDEDRLWVTELYDLRPAGEQAQKLPVGGRRFGPPPEAGPGGRGGLRVGAERIAEVELVDGAVLLPEEIPPEGVTAALEYSIPAAEDAVAFTLRYPTAVQSLQVSLAANVRGVRLAVAGGEPATARQEGASSWSTSVERRAPAEPGTPIRVTVSHLPAYVPPLWAKGALLLAAHLAGLSFLVLFRKRKPKPA